VATKPTSVVIVDDHLLVSAGIARLINSMSGFHVRAVCNTVADLTNSLESSPPEVIVLDIDMPGMSVFSLIRRIRKRHPGVAILIVSGMPPDIYALRVMVAGAMGFVGKDAGAETLQAALRSVAEGRPWLSGPSAGSLLKALKARKRIGVDALSSREVEVFQLLGKGLSPREVGVALHINHRTVASHRLRIYQKLEISSVGELVRWATEYERSAEPS